MGAVVGAGGSQSPRRSAEADTRRVPRRTARGRAATEEAKAAFPGGSAVRAGGTPRPRRPAEADARRVPRTTRGRAVAKHPRAEPPRRPRSCEHGACTAPGQGLPLLRARCMHRTGPGSAPEDCRAAPRRLPRPPIDPRADAARAVEVRMQSGPAGCARGRGGAAPRRAAAAEGPQARVPPRPARILSRTARGPRADAASAVEARMQSVPAGCACRRGAAAPRRAAAAEGPRRAGRLPRAVRGQPCATKSLGADAANAVETRVPSARAGWACRRGAAAPRRTAAAKGPRGARGLPRPARGRPRTAKGPRTDAGAAPRHAAAAEGPRRAGGLPRTGQGLPPRADAAAAPRRAAGAEGPRRAGDLPRTGRGLRRTAGGAPRTATRPDADAASAVGARMPGAHSGCAGCRGAAAPRRAGAAEEPRRAGGLQRTSTRDLQPSARGPRAGAASAVEARMQRTRSGCARVVPRAAGRRPGKPRADGVASVIASAVGAAGVRVCVCVCVCRRRCCCH